jgi:hypothetical protein
MSEKSAREILARAYGAFEIGGSIDDMFESDREKCWDFADRTLDDLSAAGLAIVPVEPTPAMLHAATMEVPTWDDEASRRKWSAMLAAKD